MTKRPLHLWIVGLIGLLWNAFGCWNYVMTQTRNEAWLAGLTPGQRAYVETFPAWSEAAWAIGVWFGLLGAILLLLQSRWAVAAFLVSILGLAGTAVYQFLMSSPPHDLVRGSGLILHLVIWAIAIGLLLYARRMRARGVLR
jgi:hypothetical protein